MRIGKLILVPLAVVAIIYLFGLTISPGNCSTIGTCRQCWNNEATNLTSDLCPVPGTQCTASPAQQQHNAVVDVLLCGCALAQEKDYTDTGLNNEIESALAAFTGDTTLTARGVCDSPGLLLTKRQYG